MSLLHRSLVLVPALGALCLSLSEGPVGAAQTGEATNLQASAEAFNRSVALVAAAESVQQPKSAVLEPLLVFAGAAGVTINNVSFSSFADPIRLSGSARSEDGVIAFKTALTGDHRFSAIDLPLTGIQTNGSDNVSFAMKFVFLPQRTQ